MLGGGNVQVRSSEKKRKGIEGEGWILIPVRHWSVPR